MPSYQLFHDPSQAPTKQSTKSSDSQHQSKRYKFLLTNPIKMTQFSVYQQQQPETYGRLTTSIGRSSNEKYAYHHSIAKKQNSWFGHTTIHLILRKGAADNSGRFILYFQKFLSLDLHQKYLGESEPMRWISIASLKMVARQERSLIVAFLNDKNKLDELNLLFATAKVAEEWELLLRDKKAEAKQMERMSQDKTALINSLIESVKALEGQLSRLKEQCNNLLEENTTIKQQNNQYRLLVRSLQNQMILFRSQRKYSQQYTEVKINIKQKEQAISHQNSSAIIKLVEQMQREVDSIHHEALGRLLDSLKKQLKIKVEGSGALGGSLIVKPSKQSL